MNGNVKPVSPYPSIPLLEGVSGEGQAEHVEEPSDVVVIGDAAFNEPTIFIHAPRFEWRPEVHVQEQDEGARQWIVAIEELLHLFGCKMEAWELELHQRLDEVHTRSDGLAKELHDLQHYGLTHLESCFASLESLENQVKQNTVSTQQTSDKVKALVDLVAKLEREWRKADFEEFRNRLHAKKEKIWENWGYQNVLDAQLDDLDQEQVNAQAQLLHKIQELDVKIKQEKELLDKQSGQVEEMQEQAQDL